VHKSAAKTRSPHNQIGTMAGKSFRKQCLDNAMSVGGDWCGKSRSSEYPIQQTYYSTIEELPDDVGKYIDDDTGGLFL